MISYPSTDWLREGRGCSTPPLPPPHPNRLTAEGVRGQIHQIRYSDVLKKPQSTSWNSIGFPEVILNNLRPGPTVKEIMVKFKIGRLGLLTYSC